MHRMARESSVSRFFDADPGTRHSFLAQKALPGCHITHHLVTAAKVGAAQRLSIYVLLRSVGDGREEQGTSQVDLQGAASSLCAAPADQHHRISDAAIPPYGPTRWSNYVFLGGKSLNNSKWVLTSWNSGTPHVIDRRTVLNTIIGIPATTGLEATICVKREPIGICLTMPDYKVKWEVDPCKSLLSQWHSSHFSHRAALIDTGIISTMIRHAVAPTELVGRLNWGQFFAALTPIWLPDLTPWVKHKQFFLGSVVSSPHNPRGPSSPIAYIPSYFPVRIKEWTLGRPPKSSPADLYNAGKETEWQRFTFPPGSFNTAEIDCPVFMSSYIEFDNSRTEMLDPPLPSDTKRSELASNIRNLIVSTGPWIP
ncbi:hypothetical protein B0H14DRAFT_3128928 [Mycena olivaceomarginata]|nr:hypothetical protein B0H14DRAFT_3128928 [Mycena olivaceomarginata]